MTALGSLGEALRKRIKTSGDCWVWDGAVTPRGYGHLRHGGLDWRAHRAAYSAFTGVIPRGSFVLHRCDVRACINPAHLFLGSARDNTADMIVKGRCRSGIRQKERTHCPSGHAYIGENLFRSGNRRRCRACERLSCRRRRAMARVAEGSEVKGWRRAP